MTPCPTPEIDSKTLLCIETPDTSAGVIRLRRVTNNLDSCLTFWEQNDSLQNEKTTHQLCT